MRIGLRWLSVVAVAISAGALLVWAPPGKAVNGCSVPVVGGVYQVSTAMHVQALHTCSLDGDFVQTADIVMPAPTTSGSVTSNFTPFGDGADGFTGPYDGRGPFTGTYDGRGHSITGLRFTAPGQDEVGLFGGLKGASVTGLRLEDVAITGRDHVGGLAGEAFNSEVRSVQVSGRVEGVREVGGVIGVGGYCLPEQCGVRRFVLEDVHFSGWVEVGGDAAGGIASALFADGPGVDGAFEVEVSRVSAHGVVRGQGESVGGLFGNTLFESSGGNLRILISQGVASNDTFGTEFVAGAFGDIATTGPSGRLEIFDVYATGAVAGANSVGGALGASRRGALGASRSAGLGGLISLERVYARGAVRASGSDFGGLVGVRVGNSPEYASVGSSFWNPTAAGVAVSDGGTESTVAAMRTLGLYRDAGWAIVDQWAAPSADRVWGICASVNDGYPFLLWEYAESPCARPAAPTGVEVQPRDRSALVSFTAPAAGDAPITGYEYSVDDGASWTAFAAARSTGPLRITGLRNGTAYQVRVRARNVNGDGPASAAVRVVSRTRRVTLSKPRRSSPYSVVVRMRVRGPGVASIVGTRVAGDRRRARVRVCRRVLRPRKPGIVVLRCRVNAATRAALRDGAVSVRLRIAYRPVGGSARVVTRSVRLPAYTPTPGPVTG